MNIDSMLIGACIRLRRQHKKMSQSELAEKIHKSVRSIQQYESGKTCPSIPMINTLSEALDTTPGFLLGFTHEEECNLNTISNLMTNAVPTDMTACICIHLLAYRVSAPLKTVNNRRDFCCPRCSSQDGLYNSNGLRNKRCGVCGQALKWPKEWEET